MVMVPENVSVTITGSGVVGRLAISPSQANDTAASDSAATKRIEALIRKWILLRT
jgi:hypothetical protein